MDYGDFLTSYDQGGWVSQMVYPSGRIVNYEADTAGRLTAVKKADNTAYARVNLFAPHGPPRKITLGNNLVEQWFYSDQRLQPRRVQLGTAATANSVGEWEFRYCGTGNYATECTNNNGNLRSEVIQPLGATENFTYDAFNRLKTMTEGSIFQTYVYDRYGNRGVLNGSWVPSTNQTPSVLADTESSVTAVFPNNQWTGATHDQAGNEKTAPGQTSSYTAGNLLKSVMTSAGTTQYEYDGQDRRVRKLVGGGATTAYVYDAAGKLAAEYSTGLPASTTGTQYVTDDHLGSTRVVTDGSGVVAAGKRYDYLPFGEEIGAGIGGRGSDYSVAAYGTTASGVVPDQLLFTGHMRDAETGLDYFGARYFSGAQGRFTTPDEFPGGLVDPFTSQQVGQPGPLPYADITDPQTLNKYGYVRNNPLRFIDPDGHETQATLSPEQAQEAGDTIGNLVGGFAIGVINNAIRADNTIRKGLNLFGGHYEQIQEIQPENSLQEFGAQIGMAVAVPGPKEGKGGARTEPTLPGKTIVSESGVTIQHYTRSGEHGPAHLHVKGEGAETRIGQAGKPLKGDPPLSSSQARVVQQNKGTIRGSVDKIMRWFNYNREQGGK